MTGERRHLATRLRVLDAPSRAAPVAASRSSICCCCRSARRSRSLWVNTAPESYYRFTYAIAFAVNDVAMVFFFALMTKEVVEATAPGGVLHPWRRALLPMVAAIGATLLPALIYIQAVDLLDEPMLRIAWPVAFATDIAVSYFIARIIFRRHPAMPFLLLLGDRLRRARFPRARLVNPAADLHLLHGALIMAVAIGVAFGAATRARQRASGRICIAAGGISWLALFRSGLHPALALVPIVPFLPHAARDPGFFVDAHADGARDALSQFELWWRYPVAGGAVLLRAGECGRAAARARGGNLGPAARRDRRQAAWHTRRPPASRSRPACICPTASAGAT